MSKVVIDQSKPSLIYFPVGGKGEAIRMLLWLAKVEYNDARVTSASFQKWKQAGQLPTGQLPVWIQPDGSDSTVSECKSIPSFL